MYPITENDVIRSLWRQFTMKLTVDEFRDFE